MGQQDDSELTEHCVRSDLVYEGSFLKVKRDVVRLPNGKEGSREFILHPGAVVIIAFLDDDHVVMLRQFRYPVQQVILEFPAGKLDAGEAPLECAKRELFEETGYTAEHWQAAGKMHLAVGYADEVIHIFVARGLTAGDARLDEDEFVKVQVMSVRSLLDACRNGELTDAKSLSCLLWLQNLHNGNWVI